MTKPATKTEKLEHTSSLFSFSFFFSFNMENENLYSIPFFEAKEDTENVGTEIADGKQPRQTCRVRLTLICAKLTARTL